MTQHHPTSSLNLRRFTERSEAAPDRQLKKFHGQEDGQHPGKIGRLALFERVGDFSGGNSGLRARASLLSRPFAKTCEKIEALIGGKNLNTTISGRGNIDFYGVRPALERIQQITRELSEVTSDDLSRDDAEKSLLVLDSIFSTLTSMKEWDLPNENLRANA